MRRRSDLSSILAVGSSSNKRLRVGLGAIAVAAVAFALVDHRVGRRGQHPDDRTEVVTASDQYDGGSIGR
jgi:hypothetical protein